MQLPEDFKEFIELMNSHGVRYVMIGGYVYNLYRNPRATAISTQIAEVTIPVISAELLLKNKIATGRVKDHADAEELRAWLNRDQSDP